MKMHNDSPAVSGAAPPPASMGAEPLAARFHGVRRLAGKVRRRFKRLAGKPDNSPWVLEPHRRAAAGRSPAYVDFLFGLDYLSPNSRLVRLFHEAMAPLGLSVLLVNAANVERVTRDVAGGWLRPHAYLDLCSATEPRFWSLLETAARAGVYTVADPATQPVWTIKASSHPKLEAAGLPLPPTVILGRDEPDRDLTDAERLRVGEKCVVKPSFGVGGRGAVVGLPPTRRAIAAAREFNRRDDWLVQKMISWTRYGPRPAYLRGYNVLGQRTLMWWCKENGFDRYELLTWADLQAWNLLPAVSLIDRLAEVTGMDFFSTEIAITAGPDAGAPGAGRFCLIDYVNDQCDMDPEERPGTTPLPESWVRWVCGRFAEFVFRQKHGLPAEEHRALSLPAGPGPAQGMDARRVEARCA